MRHAGLLIGALSGLLALASPALAQDEFALAAGTLRVGVSGTPLSSGSGLSFTNIEGDDTVNVGFQVGYFVAPSISLEFGLGFLRQGGTDTTSYTFGVSYYFSQPAEASFVPFARATFLGSDTRGQRESGFTIGVGGHYYLTPDVSVDASLSYVNLGSNQTGFNLGVGVSLWFR